MESNLVLAFVDETKCDIDTAFEYLQRNLWDINVALVSWRHLHNSNNEICPKDDQDSSEKNDVKKLSRGISRATDNVNLVSKARCEFSQEFIPKAVWFFMETSNFSFTLPDLTIYGDDFKKFLEKDLIENSTLVSLEQSGRLNWWMESGNTQGPCQRLWPLSTTGDGNCLLHAASLAIWGFHDRLLTLRKALYNFLESSACIPALYRRWRWQQTKLNEQSGFVYSEDEWLKEWRNIVTMASVEPRKNGNGTSDRHGSSVSTLPPTAVSTYESLEEIHVLVLAHVLRRPVIVVADTMLRDMNNEPFAPIPFGGIYLPMEVQPKDCHRSPLLLAYDMAHFSALVAMESSDKEKLDKLFAVVPIVDSDGMLLPVQYCVDPGANYNWLVKHDQTFINSLLPGEKEQIALLKKYLDVVDLSENDTTSPDIDSEDEIEKRFIEVTDYPDSENSLFNSKNRAAKQLQSVARQFGSIGKSMSKKLKKNFGSITKVTTKPKKSDSRRMLCVEMHHIRHAYQDEMIKNYLIYAQKRFLSDQKHKIIGSETNVDNLKLQEQALLEGPLKCINANCDSYGTVLTSYMCDKCYETQRNEELLNINPDSRFGTGRSKFYRDSNMESYDAIKNIPVSKSNMNPDRTLYLSKSTFYCDNNEMAEKDTENKITESKANIKLPTENITTAVTNDVNNKHDNNANTSKKESAEILHISKFDFGNINENVNRNFISPVDKFVDHISESKLDYVVNELRDFSKVDIGNNQSDILSHFQEKKRNKIKERNNEVNIVVSNDKEDREHISGSRQIYNTDDESIHRITSNIKDISFSRPKTSESLYSTKLQRCKSNNCANLASAHTEFYCSDCNKSRMSSIIL